MFKLVLPCLLLAAAAPLVPSAQKRASDKEPVSFTQRLDNAKRAFEGQAYGVCMKELQEALALCSEKRAEAIVNALPAAPEGWEKVPDKRPEGGALGNPMAAAMSASVGSIVSCSYRRPGSQDRVQVTVTADSPIVSMFNMWVANPAALGEGAELVEYEHDDKAVLKKNGARLELQILVSKAHLCEVNAQGLDEDGLFKLFDQAAVDRLRKALGN